MKLQSSPLALILGLLVLSAANPVSIPARDGSVSIPNEKRGGVCGSCFKGPRPPGRGSGGGSIPGGAVGGPGGSRGPGSVASSQGNAGSQYGGASQQGSVQHGEASPPIQGEGTPPDAAAGSRDGTDSVPIGSDEGSSLPVRDHRRMMKTGAATSVPKLQMIRFPRPPCLRLSRTLCEGAQRLRPGLTLLREISPFLNRSPS